MTAAFSRVFTLEVDGRPTLAFEASNYSEARQLCKETWLLDDLSLLRSDGAPLRTAQSKLSARPATAEEVTAFNRVAGLENQSDDLALGYLVKLDRPGA